VSERACSRGCWDADSIAHYKGKTEVSAATNERIPGVSGTENGVLIFKILRNALDAPDRDRDQQMLSTPARARREGEGRDDQHRAHEHPARKSEGKVDV